MDNCAPSKGTCWKSNSERNRESSRTAPVPRRPPRTQVASRTETVEIQRLGSLDRATRSAGATASLSSSATSAEVSITTEIALRPVAEDLVVGTRIQQRHRGNPAREFPHSLHFVAPAEAALLPAEFGPHGVQHRGRDRDPIHLGQTRSGLMDFRILDVQRNRVLVLGHCSVSLYHILPIQI